MTKTAEKIKIRQTGSAIRQGKKQGLYLKSLGLRRIGSEKELIVNNSVLKLIEKVRHLIKII